MLSLKHLSGSQRSKIRVRTVFYNTKVVFCTQNVLKSCIFAGYAENTGNFQGSSLLSALLLDLEWLSNHGGIHTLDLVSIQKSTKTLICIGREIVPVR